MESLILGIDPGSLKTGFGLIELKNDEFRHLNHGVIILSDESNFANRLLGLSDSLQMLLKKYQPTAVVIEKIFMGKNADSAFKLGHARGVAMTEAARGGAPIFEYATRVVKKGVAGTGAATKDQVQQALKAQLRLAKVVNFDASDALGLALYHAQVELSERRWAGGQAVLRTKVNSGGR